MNIEELDDARARELHKAAHKAAMAGLDEHKAYKAYEESPKLTKQETKRYAQWQAARITHSDALRHYQELLSELEKEEEKVCRGGWRNPGE